MYTSNCIVQRVGWGRGGWGLALAQWGQQVRLVGGVADDATDSAGSGCSSVGVVL
jgi:hypothetical protein